MNAPNDRALDADEVSQLAAWHERELATRINPARLRDGLPPFSSEVPKERREAPLHTRTPEGT